MRITLFADGIRGDVWPMVALGWHLAARDHDVTVTVPEAYRAFAERARLRAVGLPFDMGAWLATPEGQRTLDGGGVGLLRRLQREYARHADALDEVYEAAAQGAEAAVSMHLTWDRAQAMADRLGIPMAVVYPIPVTPSDEYASLILTRGRLRSRALRRLSHDLTIRLWWRGGAGATNAFRAKLGLERCTRATLRRQDHAGALGLLTVSPSLFPRPADWPETVKSTGGWELPRALRERLGETLDDDLLAWLHAGDPPVFLGFGSMPVLDPDPLLDDVVHVLRALGRRAVVSANCVSAAAARSLPPQVRAVGAVDHDRLFARCAAVVHHGGSGSTTASLRAGRPTLVCSVWGDQPWWGEQVKRLGVGAHVPFRRLSRASLQSGLRVLLDPEVDARARRLGAAIRAEGDGLPEATRLLEDWLVVAEPTPIAASRRGARPRLISQGSADGPAGAPRGSAGGRRPS